MCGHSLSLLETETDEKKLSAAENQQAFLHPMRIQEITQYILNNFRQKTHRTFPAQKVLMLCWQ